MKRKLVPSRAVAWRPFRAALVLTATVAGGAGCGTAGDTVDRIGAVTPRAGTLVLEGCTIDATQGAALSATDGARHAIKNVVLLCLAGRSDGSIAPTDPDARTALQGQLTTLRSLGYGAFLGYTLGDGGGGRYDDATAAMLLSSPTFRMQTVQSLSSLGLDFDGFEIALPPVQSSAAPALTPFVKQVAAALRPTHKVGLFVPPSVASPSDITDGDAYDIATLAPLVDRIRVMTLDFSCCGTGPGPAIDSGWAVDAARFAIAKGTDKIDVTVPLYGSDFGAPQNHALSFAEAHDLATTYKAVPVRSASGVLHFAYGDPHTGAHEVWFDDVVSSVRTLEAWSPDVLPAFVGVTWYGLGAEDPALWPALARALPRQ